jgi:hypothetical protein
MVRKISVANKHKHGEQTQTRQKNISVATKQNHGANIRNKLDEKTQAWGANSSIARKHKYGEQT